MDSSRFQIVFLVCLHSISMGVVLGKGPVDDSNIAIASENSDGASENSDGASGSARPSVGHPTFVSPHASPIALQGDSVFVVNTPADSVDVIDAKTQQVVRRIDVGVDPVSLALRPDGKELWVSNHVSDS
ncbi:MAG: YncE family protein, partial [Rubripirellula sp.]